MVLDKKYQSEKKRILDEVNRIIYKNNILKFCEYTKYDNIKEIIILGCYRIKKENISLPERRRCSLYPTDWQM